LVPIRRFPQPFAWCLEDFDDTTDSHPHLPTLTVQLRGSLDSNRMSRIALDREGFCDSPGNFNCTAFVVS
jgi:hypothetical protein